MEQQYYKFKVSPENIKGDLITVPFTGETDISYYVDPCCSTTAETLTTITGTTGYYLPMDLVLSGGTNGSSLLECLSINLFFQQTAIDIGYYSVFDGAVLQKDVVTNFILSADTVTDPLGYTFLFYNTSDTELIKFLSLVVFTVDWGDGFSQPITSSLPLQHTYPGGNNVYTVKMTANSPWGISYVEKQVVVPFTGTTISNLQGTAYFVPAGICSGTPISYDFIFSGDSNWNINDFYSYNYTNIPFTVSGYTTSSLNDLQQYGPVTNLIGGKFTYGPVTGITGVIGEFLGVSPNGEYTAYTIDNIVYYDYEDYTIYSVQSSGFTQDNLVLSAITKNEVLLNVIDQPEIITNVYVERGKYAPLESIMRLGEVDNLGDLEKYGYKFYNVIKEPT